MDATIEFGVKLPMKLVHAIYLTNFNKFSHFGSIYVTRADLIVADNFENFIKLINISHFVVHQKL